jgi:hypothetical protein
MQLLETTWQNRRSGQEVAKIQPSDFAPKRSLPKTHKDFWKERLERRCYTLDGELHEVNEYSIRIQHLGRRKSIALGTSNADAAAIKARDYYLGELHIFNNQQIQIRKAVWTEGVAV